MATSSYTGTDVPLFILLFLDTPPLKLHIYFEKLPNSFCKLKKTCALVIVALIFKLFRIISELASSLVTSVSVKRATFLASKSLNALRYPSLFLRIVSQERPAWALSNTTNSKRC